MGKSFTLRYLLLSFVCAVVSLKSTGQLSITNTTSVFTETFDGMGSSPTAPLPQGFRVNDRNTAVNWATGITNTTLASGTSGTGALTGTSSGGTYNFANGVTATSTDRSLGFLTTGSYISPNTIVLKITNNTGSTISSLNISFDYEKYRSGTRAFNWTFFHGSTATSATSASAGDQAYAADPANAVVNPPTTINKTVSLTGLSIANGADYYLRWTFTGVAGSTNGQGIGIDNVSISASPAISSNASLSGLSISSGTLSPSFTSSVTGYSATVANNMSSITVTPTASVSSSTISVNGQAVQSGSASALINLSVGDNLVTTIVTAEDGSTTKTYTINVNRAPVGTPTFTSLSPLADFGNVCVNTAFNTNSFTIDGNELDGTEISIGAVPGFSYSETATGTFSPTLSFSYTGSGFAGKTIYVRFSPTSLQSYNGNITVSGGGVSGYTIAATGAGVNSAPTISTGSSSVTGVSATLTASISSNGCTPVTAYGIEYSASSGFVNGTGTRITSSNLSNGTFSSSLSGLNASTTYYYKSYVTNEGGTTYGNQLSFTTSAVPVVMAAQPDMSFTETFSDIASWTNNFTAGNGANHFSSVPVNSTGTIPTATKITTATSTFSSGSSGGVQKGTGNIVLLSTGSTDNSTSDAIDFYMDFSGLNAGTVSFDWASINNSTGDRKGSLRVYASTNGTSFTELTAADVLNITNNVLTSGTISNVALPAVFNNSPTARLRFYYHNGAGGTTGSRPKISIDNLMVTAVPNSPCASPTAAPTSLVFGSKTEVSIQGSFTASSPSVDQYLVVMSSNSSLTLNPEDGQIYNIGDNLGDGTVIAKGASTTFTASELSAATAYYFFIFPVNSVCTGGPKYLTTNVLTADATTAAGLPICTAPLDQPSNISLSSTVNAVNGSFTPNSANEYLVLKSTSSSLTTNPVNGTIYNSGSVIGNATVIQRSNATSFTATGLTPDTKYYFYIFSLNAQGCLNGPAYNTTDPVSASQTTLPLSPCVAPTVQPVNLSLTASNSTITGTFNDVSGSDDYITIRSESATLSSTPLDNTDYLVGDSIGGGVVIANSNSTSFITNNLSASTSYYISVFAANKTCLGGTKYLTTSPLTGTVTTLNTPANNYYFGTLHAHSDYSDGNKDHPGYTPADDYNYAMSAECMDFLGISEHNHFSSVNNPGTLVSNYHKGITQANEFNASHANFLALYGMEWGVISGGGHVLVYGDRMDSLFGWEFNVDGVEGPNYDVYVPKSTYTGPNGLFKAVNDHIGTNTFATLAHPNSADFNNLSNVNYIDTADNAIVGVAVESGPANSTNTTYSNPGEFMYFQWYYDKMLSKGYHLGPTMDHDNHNTTFGKATRARTAIIAPALTQTELVKAMRDMHFYATEDCDSKVDFTVNTRIMGSVFSDRNAPSIAVNLTDATTPTTSALIRVKFGIPGSGILPVTIDSVYGNTLNFIDNNLSNNTTGYYYADITNGTSRIITSPIWYTRTCSITGDTTVYACNSFSWNGETYSQSGTYKKGGFTSVGGCDSTSVLNLVITTPTATDTTAVACESFTWYGTAYTSSTTATQVFKGLGGCDSTVTLHLTIHHNTSSSTEVTACDTYRWNGNDYTTSGQYAYHTVNATGCDSTAILVLTINRSKTTSETQTACDSYTWNSKTYTETGDYIYKWQNEQGCTNTDTLHLTINHSTTTSETQVACDSYTWNGKTYTESGDYTYQSINEQGCTNTAILHLTINHSTTTSEIITACDSYIWNGTTYTESGVYTYLSNNADGCTNTATLHLTINRSTTTTETQVSCDSYTWNGTTYTESGVYTYQSNNAAGCINTATLHLTINRSTTTSETQVACDSYTWHGTTYYQSGDYIYKSQNAQGCTNTATLHLTINPKPIVSIPAIAVLPAGVNSNTLYIGYASDATFSANVSGGSPYYSYKWMMGSGLVTTSVTNQQSVSISATGSGNYSSTLTVIITDSKGCTVTSSITISVIDVRSGFKNDKVRICHNGSDLSVDGNAVAEHLNHGDKLGACDAPMTVSLRSGIETSAPKNVQNVTDLFEVKVAPNPTRTDFKIIVRSNSAEAITIRLVDLLGRVISVNNNVQRDVRTSIGANVSTGTYFGEVIQGTNRKIVKLIKEK